MEKCLHCAVMATVHSWVEEHGPLTEGNLRVFDVVGLIENLTQCVVEVSQSPPERHQRRRAHRFSHDALDAHLKSKQTGKLVPVDIPAEH